MATLSIQDVAAQVCAIAGTDMPQVSCDREGSFTFSFTLREVEFTLSQHPSSDPDELLIDAFFGVLSEENELGALRALMQQNFGDARQAGTLVWPSPGNRGHRAVLRMPLSEADGELVWAGMQTVADIVLGVAREFALLDEHLNPPQLPQPRWQGGFDMFGCGRISRSDSFGAAPLEQARAEQRDAETGGMVPPGRGRPANPQSEVLERAFNSRQGAATRARTGLLHGDVLRVTASFLTPGERALSRGVNWHWHDTMTGSINSFHGPAPCPRGHESHTQWAAADRTGFLAANAVLPGGLSCPAAMRILRECHLDAPTVRMTTLLAVARDRDPVFRSVEVKRDGSYRPIVGSHSPTVLGQKRPDRAELILYKIQHNRAGFEGDAPSSIRQRILHGRPNYIVGRENGMGRFIHCAVHLNDHEMVCWDPATDLPGRLRSVPVDRTPALPDDFGGVYWLGRSHTGFVALGKNGSALVWDAMAPENCRHLQFKSPCIEVIRAEDSGFLFFRLQNMEMHSLDDTAGPPAISQPIKCPEGLHIADLGGQHLHEIPVILSDGSAAFLDASGTEAIAQPNSEEGDVFLCAATSQFTYAFAGIDKAGAPFWATPERRVTGDIQTIHMSHSSLIIESDDGYRHQVVHGAPFDPPPHQCFGSMPAVPPSSDDPARRRRTAFSRRV